MKKHLLILCSILLLVCTASSGSATTIVYNNFSDLSAFQLNGSTAAISNPVTYGGQSVLRLTDNLSQSGSAFLKDTIALEDAGGFNASFSTFFSFQITDPQGISDGFQGADGIVFTIQTIANNVGGTGGGIGYFGIDNSVGIEFDTWNNGSWDENNGNHVGINLNGEIDSVVQYNALPAQMNNGAIWYAWVDYDGDTDNLEVRLAQESLRPAAAILSYAVDLTGILGTENAYIGFTSGTGAAGGDHDIRSWEFRSEFAPITNVIPEPTTMLLFGFGLLGLAGVSRRKK